MKKSFTASISLIAISIFAGLVCAGDKAEVRFPEINAGKLAESYLSAFNSDNENDMRTYLEQNVAPPKLKERPLFLCPDSAQIISQEENRTITSTFCLSRLD